MLKIKTGSLSEISAIIHKSSHSVRNVVTILTDRLFLWPESMYIVFILKIDAWIQCENIHSLLPTLSGKNKHVNRARRTLKWAPTRVHVSGSIYKIIWTRVYKVTLVTIHQSTGQSILENMDLHQHFCENLKSHKLDKTTVLQEALL